MLITKSESKELVKLQIKKFRILEAHCLPVPHRILQHSEDTYSYRFIVGRTPKRAELEYYLERYLWQIPKKRVNLTKYNRYLDSVAESLGRQRKPIIGIFNPCFVHGDATPENFIHSGYQIYAIDFGNAHGANCSYYDKAKMEQEYITNWRYICFGGVPTPYEELHRNIAILRFLYDHWLRILNNVNRHNNRVRAICPKVVRLLEEEVEATNGLPSGYRWDHTRIKELYLNVLSICDKEGS